MAQLPIDRLRGLLGERIMPGETDADTLFTDAELLEILGSTPDLDRAAYQGWREKAATLSNLVDTTEGNAQRKFSQLLANAQDMVKLYSRSSNGPTENRARVGRIRREPLEW